LRHSIKLKRRVSHPDSFLLFGDISFRKATISVCSFAKLRVSEGNDVIPIIADHLMAS
jgi:hypothetical protein